MKKLKKFLKFSFFGIVGLISLAIIFSIFYYHTVTASSSLDTEKLEALSQNSLQIYDCNDQMMSFGEKSSLDLNSLKKNTIDAFLCAEDKRFYSHNGIDYIRLGGAILNNIKTHSFSQGGSTISQQLIKNTQLSNEKTIKRKLKEYKLTRQLEKNYSKNDILKMYLENIYFGGGCYGIENASMHYFGKSAKDLSLSESAVLAGTINAPSIYDIERKQENSINRRNLILKLMQSQGKISEEEYESASSEPITLNITSLKCNEYSYNQIIKEATEILGIGENELKCDGYKIYTYQNENLTKEINEIIEEKYNLDDVNVSCLVLDNKTGGTITAIGSNGLSNLHQPGSTIKPILVYAPAIENNMISPATKILDNKINYGGYSPENADHRYHGFVSVRDSLKYSYNIPAVKILNEIGIENAQQVAQKFGIKFSEKDNNLSIALGGFTDGLSIKSLADAYMTLACGGEYKSSNYISKITKNGKIIFKNKVQTQTAISPETAYLVTDMLKSTASSGTARRLANLDFDVASKTGTVGGKGYNTNTFNVSYTNDHTIITYFGGENLSENINGSTYPTMLAKDILNKIYENKSPKNFKIPSGVKLVNLSKDSYENNIVVSAENNEESFTELFSENNLPKTKYEH